MDGEVLASAEERIAVTVRALTRDLERHTDRVVAEIDDHGRRKEGSALGNG
jgi:hypothetical protein